MFSPQSDDSDNQGFIQNTPQIDSHTSEVDHKQTLSFKAFRPRYIHSEFVLTKEPPEILGPVGQVQIINLQHLTNKCLDQIQQKTQLPQFTLFQQYLYSNKYTIVYTKFRRPFSQDKLNPFQNQIKLKDLDKTINFKQLKQWKQNTSIQYHLQFDSCFQGGNLLCAFKDNNIKNKYTLFMQNDTNTFGYSQWFYFSIKGAKPNTSYHFQIVNFKKPYSFFKKGQKITMFSLKQAQISGKSYYRQGQNIKYYPSPFVANSKYYSLSFTFQVQHQNDTIFMSQNIPYSYSRLLNYLDKLQVKANQNNINFKKQSVSKSLASNDVPYITISKGNKKKKSIVIFARQHSGQIWSSYLIQSILDQIVSQQKIQSKYLLQKYQFHVFPMINVDGVIYGNFRCDLSGSDLNRSWQRPLIQVSPQIYDIKKKIIQISNQSKIQLCIDLHTHGKDFGAFAFCCIQSQQCKQIPRILSKANNYFRLDACTFGISNQKKKTARALVYSLTNNINTLTIQLSSFGYKYRGRNQGQPFTINHISGIGQSIIVSFYCYLTKTQPSKIIQITSTLNKQQLQRTSATKLPTQQLQINQPVQGSDSQPQVDQIAMEIKLKKIFPKNMAQQIAYQQQKYKRKISKLLKKQKITVELPVKLQKINKKISKKNNPVTQQQASTQIAPQFQSLQFKQQKKQTVLPLASKNTKQSTNYYITTKRRQRKNQKIKNQDQRPQKQINLVQFSLKKLPVNLPQKILQRNVNDPQNINVFQPFSIYKRQNRFDKTFSTYEAMVRPRARANLQNKRIGFSNLQQQTRIEQQLPFLCIMSQNKKQLQFQKIKQNQRKMQQANLKKLKYHVVHPTYSKQQKYVQNLDKQSNTPIYSLKQRIFDNIGSKQQIIAKIFSEHSRYLGRQY